MRSEVAMHIPKWVTSKAMKYFIKQMWYFTYNRMSTRVLLENNKAKAPLIKAYESAMRKRTVVFREVKVREPLFLSAKNAEILGTVEFAKKYTEDKRVLKNNKLMQMIWLVGRGNTTAQYFIFFQGSNPNNKVRWASEFIARNLGINTYSVDIELQREDGNRR